jgi:hypothetical protein
MADIIIEKLYGEDPFTWAPKTYRNLATPERYILKL